MGNKDQDIKRSCSLKKIINPVASFFSFLLSHHVFCQWVFYVSHDDGTDMYHVKWEHPKSTSPEWVRACGRESEPAVKDSAQLCATSPWKHQIDESKTLLVDHECCAETSLIFVRGITSQTEVSCLTEEEFDSESVENYPKEEEKSTIDKYLPYFFYLDFQVPNSCCS